MPVSYHVLVLSVKLVHFGILNKKLESGICLLCMLTVFFLRRDFVLCMSMKEDEIAHLFPLRWDGIHEADPVTRKTPFCQVPSPSSCSSSSLLPPHFTVSSFIKITLALLEQPYFVRIYQKRMSQTIWLCFVKFVFDLLGLVQIWTHLVQFIFNTIQTLAQALILVILV